MRLRRSSTPLPPAPDCHQVGSVLQSFLDGELGPQDAEIVQEHLGHCQRCGIEAATVGKVIDAIQRQRPDLDPGALDRLSGFVDGLTVAAPDADDGSDGPSEPEGS